MFYDREAENKGSTLFLFWGTGDLRVVMLSRMRRGWAGEKVSQAAEIANAKAKVES